MKTTILEIVKRELIGKRIEVTTHLGRRFTRDEYGIHHEKYDEVKQSGKVVDVIGIVDYDNYYFTAIFDDGIKTATLSLDDCNGCEFEILGDE